MVKRLDYEDVNEEHMKWWEYGATGRSLPTSETGKATTEANTHTLTGGGGIYDVSAFFFVNI